MRVAQLEINLDGGLFGGWTHTIGFATEEEAREQHDRLASLLERKERRANDLPPTVTVVGIETVTFSTSRLAAISATYYASANEHMEGVAETFPHLNFVKKHRGD